MTVTILENLGQTATTSLADFGSEVAASHSQKLDVRACNIGAADAYIDLYLVKTADTTKNHYRCKNFPVPYQQDGSAVDLELGLFLAAGWKLQIRGSAASTIVVSRTGVDKV